MLDSLVAEILKASERTLDGVEARPEVQESIRSKVFLLCEIDGLAVYLSLIHI